MSGACAPSASPWPSHEMTALRWRRFPLTSTSVWSGARPTQARRPHDGRHVAVLLRVDMERQKEQPQLVGEIRVALAQVGFEIASIGTVDSVTDRGGARLPTTTSSSNCGVGRGPGTSPSG